MISVQTEDVKKVAGISSRVKGLILSVLLFYKSSHRDDMINFYGLGRNCGIFWKIIRGLPDPNAIWGDSY